MALWWLAFYTALHLQNYAVLKTVKTMLLIADLAYILDCEEFLSNKIILYLQMSVKVAFLRHCEMSGDSFVINALIILSDAQSDCSIIGNQAVLFCDLQFPHRYDMSLKTPGAWLIMLLAGSALFCILQMLYPVVLNFMRLLRLSWKICDVVYVLYIMCYRTEKKTFSALQLLPFVTRGISFRSFSNLHMSCCMEKQIILLVAMYSC